MTQYELGQTFYLTRSRTAPITDADAFWRGYYAEQRDARQALLALQGRLPHNVR